MDLLSSLYQQPASINFPGILLLTTVIVVGHTVSKTFLVPYIRSRQLNTWALKEHMRASLVSSTNANPPVSSDGSGIPVGRR
jgi:hypothetical protein